MKPGDRTAPLHTRTLRAWSERWPIAGTFTISRGAKTEAEVVVVELREGEAVGRGECVPYARYGETTESVLEALAAYDPGTARTAIGHVLRGAARSAVDLATWELEARLAGTSVAALAGLAPPARIETAITISIDAPDAMGARARELAERPLLKLKLAGDGLDLARVEAVRAGAPAARLWVDANEGWDETTYAELAPRLAALGVTLLEQPFPAGRDGALARGPRPVPVCADESAHDARSIALLRGRYDAVNVKLDKAGGLTGALDAIEAARAARMKVVLGCMVSTSLAIAPACLLAGRAELCDLDGSLLLARDREGGARLEGGLLVPPTCWG